MSILTTLALMVTASFAKQPPDPEIAKLKAKIDSLEAELKELRANRDGWQDLAMRWSERARHLADHPLRMAQHQAQYQQAMQNAAQYQQGLQNAANQLAQGPLGMLHEFCNCVPARHDLFRLG